MIHNNECVSRVLFVKVKMSHRDAVLQNVSVHRKNFFQKPLDKSRQIVYTNIVACLKRYGSLAQLGEHLPYKQRVIGSSPIVSTMMRSRITAPQKYGLVVQLVRTPPCHGGGRGFESHPGRHCGFSSSGRAPPCQGGGSEFEPRNPLQFFHPA